MSRSEALDLFQKGIRGVLEFNKKRMLMRPELEYFSNLERNQLLWWMRPDLSAVNLKGAHLEDVNFSGTNLERANLENTDLRGANLRHANLRYANLKNADLAVADMCGANLENALLVDCRVYGVSAWDVNLNGTIQRNLNISGSIGQKLFVDNLKIAQFLYLLLNESDIREAIDTITSKVVLILGRFHAERKSILDAIRIQLRKLDYVPVLFDFDKPSNRDLTETISTLAHMSRFIIADITDAKSIPQELQAIVPNLPSVPIQPLLECSAVEYAMFEHFHRYPWVLPIYHYDETLEPSKKMVADIISAPENKMNAWKIMG